MKQTTYQVEITLPSDTEVMMTRQFDAPRSVVFDAWTNPKYVPQWMLGEEGWSMTLCEIDLRPGGTWHMAWRKPDGAEMEMSGVYKEVEPATRVVSTERWGPEWPETVNTVALTEDHGMTTLTLTILYPSKADRDAAFETGMQDGATFSFNKLEQVLSSLARRGG